MVLTLPYPPSINHYWRRVGQRTLISREGRTFRKKVCALLGRGIEPLEGRLAVVLDIYPPDRRRRDIDNVQKALLDAVEHAGVYRDDSQVDLLITRRRDVVKGGRAVVHITDISTARNLLSKLAKELHA
ncbi:Crossover junction endodeoxyribonuclease RusA [Anaerohalosphaera lusitana]|uniref:Crossover junction endodeoxyribonuclease RusA n=1 Tax=Anaerohalosphaera lusitana TaxID=1936003 RepID=A0A1U9NJL4_9BACT|nr:RusA family crossover junction endodeoxyribonuclease [Anaerohalosphaera lusitana]AQT67924.1 Crossover junction endodeoxyribonuclease RusA [Anaerohalosphaera lusitana]